MDDEKTRTRARGLRTGARLHGDVRPGTADATRTSRSRRSTARSSSASPSSTPPTCTAPASARTSSSSAARSRTGATRSCSRRSSRTSSARTAPRGVNGRPEYVRSAIEASLARLGRRPRRPLLPAPRRQDGADRGDGRRDGRARRRGQGAPPRPLGGVAGHDPPRARRPPDHRAPERSTRSGRAIRRTGSSPTTRELGIGFVAYSPLGRGFLTGRFRSADDFADDDFRKHQPALPGRRLPAELGSARARAARSPPRRASRRRSSRSPGCSRRATTSSRSPARSAAATSRRTPPPPRSS